MGKKEGHSSKTTQSIISWGIKNKHEQSQIRVVETGGFWSQGKGNSKSQGPERKSRRTEPSSQIPKEVSVCLASDVSKKIRTNVLKEKYLQANKLQKINKHNVKASFKYTN